MSDNDLAAQSLARAEWLTALTNPGMGTEAVGPLLACLVRLARPRRVLEVGAGSTSLHLLAGLVEAKRDADADRALLVAPERDRLRASVLHPASVMDRFEPALVVVDDLSVEGSTAHGVAQAAEELGLDKHLTWVEKNFFDVTEEDLAGLGPFGLVWLDAGTQADDARFLRHVWPHLEPGGLLGLHEPHVAALVQVDGLARSVVRLIPSPVLQELRREARDPARGFEVLALTETHKYRQAGLLLVRKLAPNERDREGSLAEEMCALGDEPVPDGPLLGDLPLH